MGDKGQDMKQKLIEFLRNHVSMRYPDEINSDDVEWAIDDFFKQYQPERLNESTSKGDAKV